MPEIPKCEVCGGPANSEKDGLTIIYCAKCDIPHHIDCWKYNKKCSIFGCGETKYVSETTVGPQPTAIIPNPQKTLSESDASAVMTSFIMIAIIVLLPILFYIGKSTFTWITTPGPWTDDHARLEYSPTLNAMVCTYPIDRCIGAGRDCVIVHYKNMPDPQNCHRPIEQLEIHYYHPYCKICGVQGSKETVCQHLKWLFEPITKLNVTRSLPTNYCNGRFYDCIRKNEKCITKKFGKTGELVCIQENQQHVQCSTCGNYFSEGCNPVYHKDIKNFTSIAKNGSLNSFNL